MKLFYREMKLSRKNRERLDQINEIIKVYQRKGYVLTLRQLYYQLVSQDIIANNVQEYGRLSLLLKEGRMAGLVDWSAIEDRLREPSRPPSWKSPSDILDVCIRQYRKDRTEGQSNYIEVWVEKDALSGVLKRVTEKYGINIVVNRGYSSVTAMHDAHLRFERHIDQFIHILYIGDFDPSGQDMIRDIEKRIEEFNGTYDFKITPIALTLQQIKEYNPPPNPAKITDPRAKKYIEMYGPVSWEVDALKPEILHSILENHIRQDFDIDEYSFILKQEEQERDILKQLKENLE